MTVKLLLGLMLLLTAACGPLALSDRGPPETKDRLSTERMQQLVNGPMQFVNEGRLNEGEAEFQRLLDESRRTHGERSVEVADLQSSFALQLFLEGSDETRYASRKYFQQAIPAFRAAFGADHPEVAVALNDLASVEQRLSPDDPAPVVEELLRETLRIRLEAFGPAHHETRATMTYLANVYSLPAWLASNPEHFRHADVLYRRAIAGSGTGHTGDPATNGAAIRLRLATLYARTGHQREAMSLVRQSLAISEDWPAEPACALVESRLNEVVEILIEKGADTARALKPEGNASACFQMTQPTWFERMLMKLGLF